MAPSPRSTASISTSSAAKLFGLIGHNGAGKSTLFRMMLGLVRLSAGEIRIGGVRVDGGDFRAVRRTVAYLPENVVLYDNLTGSRRCTSLPA
jgi:Cu-processing system ATP-binding protein